MKPTDAKIAALARDYVVKACSKGNYVDVANAFRKLKVALGLPDKVGL